MLGKTLKHDTSSTSDSADEHFFFNFVQIIVLLIFLCQVILTTCYASAYMFKSWLSTLYTFIIASIHPNFFFFFWPLPSSFSYFKIKSYWLASSQDACILVRGVLCCKVNATWWFGYLRTKIQQVTRDGWSRIRKIQAFKDMEEIMDTYTIICSTGETRCQSTIFSWLRKSSSRMEKNRC